MDKGLCQMSEKKIGEIKNELKECGGSELKDFIAAYEEDERTGVKACVESAKKKLSAYEAEISRTLMMSRFEMEYGKECELVCGIDEVGRGPLAGPVVACACILDKNERILYLDDSKKLSAKKREELYGIIMEKAIAVGLGEADNIRIDEINILQATYEAMRMAIQKLSKKPDILLNDAVTIPEVEIRQVPIIKGDQKSVSIAAASIVAKVFRDRMMDEFDKIYPLYDFKNNKGYGTMAHIKALREYGPCPIHRRSFISFEG